jgi:hypothetical protein
MKNKEVLLLLGIMVVITAGVNYVISLVNYQLWVSLTLYTLSFVAVGFMVLLVAGLIATWQSHQRKIKRLLNADKAKTDQRERLQKNQSEIIDYNLSNRLVDFDLVKEEVESIRKNLLSSIEYEETSIAKKQQIIEGYKQLLNELNGVNDNGEINKETKTL